MIKSTMITECWTAPQNNHRDTFFSIYLVYIHITYIETLRLSHTKVKLTYQHVW